MSYNAYKILQFCIDDLNLKSNKSLPSVKSIYFEQVIFDTLKDLSNITSILECI